MQRITISVDDELLGQFDAYMTAKGYGNRSEAFRDLVRDRLSDDRLRPEVRGHCLACFSFVYNHHKRELARRLVEAQHAHHDLGVTTLHVHLDHENCMEAMILQGQVEDVRSFADAISAEGGVRNSSLHLLPVEREQGRHTHAGQGEAGHVHSHGHVHPRT